MASLHPGPHSHRTRFVCRLQHVSRHSAHLIPPSASFRDHRHPPYWTHSELSATKGLSEGCLSNRYKSIGSTELAACQHALSLLRVSLLVQRRMEVMSTWTGIRLRGRNFDPRSTSCHGWVE
eukprot:1830959-Amphidinium_carterae.1